MATQEEDYMPKSKLDLCFVLLVFLRKKVEIAIGKRTSKCLLHLGEHHFFTFIL